MSLAPQIAALRRIASRARATRIASSAKMLSVPPLSLPHPPQGSPTQGPPDICSSPPSISMDLMKLGLRPADALKISQAFERSALAYKTHVEAEYATARRALQRIPYGSHTKQAQLHPLLATTYSSSYLKVVEKWRSTILEKVKQRIRELKDALHSQQAHAKKSFDISALPALERSFEQNPRPSRAEKQRLAADLGMEYKQITVWFQNRRNRSKKVAHVVAPVDADDTDSNLPPDLAAALIRILERYVIPAGCVYAQQDETSKLAISFAPFHVNRPSHAWPVAFPPLCSDDPFPLSASVRMFPTSWYRTPAQSPASPRVGDETGLLALLERWNIRAEGSNSRKQRTDLIADMGPTACLSPDPLSTANCGSSTPRTSGEEVPSLCCEGCTGTGSPHTSQQAACSSLPTTTRARFLWTAHTAAASFSALVDRARGRHRARPNCPLDIPPSVSDASGTPRDEPSAATSAPISRGRPYPKGKPSKPKIATRSVPAISQKLRASDRVSSTSTPPRVPGQCTGSSTPRAPSPPTALPALSRESSVSSLRSVSSTSSSMSDEDLLLTPPLFPTSVLDYPVPDYLTCELSAHASKDPSKGPNVDAAPRGAAYLRYSLACGDRDLALGISSALYSQIQPPVPFLPEPPLIPTISPLVLVY